MSDVGEYIQYGWAVYVGADIFGFTLYNETWEDSTSFKC